MCETLFSVFSKQPIPRRQKAARARKRSVTKMSVCTVNTASVRNRNMHSAQSTCRWVTCSSISEEQKELTLWNHPKRFRRMVTSFERRPALIVA